MTPTLSQIAADVRRLAPEVFPVGLNLEDGSKTIWLTSARGTYPAPKEVARHTLGFAMVLATDAARDTRSRHTGATWRVRCPKTGVYRVEHDREHGGDPLLSLHAAFLWAKETPDAK